MYTASAMPIRGWRPWESPDSSPRQEEHIETDTQEQIDTCLERCPYRECVNCIAGGTHVKNGRPASIEPEMVEYLIALKEMDKDICKEVCENLGYSMRTVCYYAKKNERGNGRK